MVAILFLYMYDIGRCLTCNTQHWSGSREVNLNYISSPKTQSVSNVLTSIVCAHKAIFLLKRKVNIELFSLLGYTRWHNCYTEQKTLEMYVCV